MDLVRIGEFVLAYLPNPASYGHDSYTIGYSKDRGLKGCVEILGLPISRNGPDRTGPDLDPNPRNGPEWRGTHARNSRPPEIALPALACTARVSC